MTFTRRAGMFLLACAIMPLWTTNVDAAPTARPGVIEQALNRQLGSTLAPVEDFQVVARVPSGRASLVVFTYKPRSYETNGDGTPNVGRQTAVGMALAQGKRITIAGGNSRADSDLYNSAMFADEIDSTRSTATIVGVVYAEGDIALTGSETLQPTILQGPTPRDTNLSTPRVLIWQGDTAKIACGYTATVDGVSFSVTPTGGTCTP